jgi:hypothetical protein
MSEGLVSQQETAKGLQERGAASQERADSPYQDMMKAKKGVIVDVQYACADVPNTTYIAPSN